eukprot:6490681-Amphidinium_carterae.2
MAGIPEEFAMVMVHEAQSGVPTSTVTIGAGATVNIMSQGRLKAPAPPPPQSTTPRPSTSANPTSPTGAAPTGTAGQPGASTTPMDTDGEQPDDTMGAQSISSGSTSSIATTIVMDIESMMWDSIMTPQCAPVVLQQLIETEFAPQFYTSNNEHLKVLTMISNTATIQRDRFIPTAAMNDTNNYLWFTWLTEAQYNDFSTTGQVPGYKDTRGDNVHKHHRLHNTPDHCVNLHIHTRWNAAVDNDNYGVNKPIYLLVWKTSINNVWPTVTLRPMHILQSTSAERRMSQLSTSWEANWRLDNGRLAQNRQQCVDNLVVGSLNLSLVCHRDTMASQ